ncbi:hypothetical protein GA0074695_1116 [Micromonospora viridifaciens]|uniref:DUF3291 domain-containing protein n=1 Tax=Micromonospora viridifaciens TaxID=1881 RepID=A0A1C4V4R0_MICVI|nr:hypothetical protein [Micromonospora viridifaciens]SCE78781.1 hypothetical protein GA0074695_1116 [Micromonospora viridifaciens]
MTATLEPDPAQGQVVITRFHCGDLARLLLVLMLHIRVKRDVRRHASGFLGIKLLVEWRQRTVWSISLWRDLDSVYSMGAVSRHVAASRVPAKLGVSTSCDIFCHVGEWTRVMFGGAERRSGPGSRTGE